MVLYVRVRVWVRALCRVVTGIMKVEPGFGGGGLREGSGTVEAGFGEGTGTEGRGHHLEKPWQSGSFCTG